MSTAALADFKPLPDAKAFTDQELSTTPAAQVPKSTFQLIDSIATESLKLGKEDKLDQKASQCVRSLEFKFNQDIQIGVLHLNFKGNNINGGEKIDGAADVKLALDLSGLDAEGGAERGCRTARGRPGMARSA